MSKLQSNRQNWRNRWFKLVLYPESQQSVIDYIKSNMRYAMILHDKDVDSLGELKKPHVHVILNFKSARWCSALADELQINDRFIQKYNGLEDFAYLIHYNNENKYQYPLYDVEGPLFKYVEKSMVNKDELEDTLSDFMSFVDDTLVLSWRDVFSLVCQKGVYNEINRGWLFREVLAEAINENNRRIGKVD